MNNGACPSRAPRRTRDNLAARATPTRTFGGLLAFTALIFLCCGMYLVSGPLLDPVKSHDVGILAGACAIALASILLFYLAKGVVPRRRVQAEARREMAAQAEEEPCEVARRLTLEPIHVRRTRIRA